MIFIDRILEIFILVLKSDDEMLLLIAANLLFLLLFPNWYNSALFYLFIEFEAINSIFIWVHWSFSFTVAPLCYLLSHSQMLRLFKSQPLFIGWPGNGRFRDGTTVGFVCALRSWFMLLLSETLSSVAVLACSFKWELLFFYVFLTLIIM